jgi:hypothetical protein
MSAGPHGLEPGAVAEEFVWLLLLEQFEAATAHLDPVELDAFRAQFFAAADELDSPRERAALLAVFGGERLSELRELTAEQFFVRFMGAASAASRRTTRPPPDVDRGQLRSFWVEATAADGDPRCSTSRSCCAFRAATARCAAASVCGARAAAGASCSTNVWPGWRRASSPRSAAT